MLDGRGSSLVALALTLTLALGGGACGRDEPRADAASASRAVAGSLDVAGPPTFAGQVAPLVWSRCAGCHHEGGPGPFSLLDYGEVSDHAEQIVEVTQTGYMPPWLPRAGYGRFADERRLSSAEREVLAAWVAAGRPSGDLESLPPRPRFTTDWQLGPPDLVLGAGAGWTVPADGPDIYRNFVVPVPEGPTRFVKAVELRPGPARVVHHAVMRVDTTGEARRREAADADPGFEGMVVLGARMPGGQFVGWTPGRAPDPGDEARAWPLVGGSDLIVQVHVRPTGKVEVVRPELGLYFAPGPPTRPSLALVLSTTDIDIPVGDRTYTRVDSLELPVAVRATSIYPHAHYLATQIEAWAILPGGRREWLLSIDDWDFNWQDQYRFAHPIELPAGTVIHVSYRYDNSADNPRNPSSPPRRVRFGPESTDEMAELIVEVEPRDPRDLVALDRVLEQRWLEVQIETSERRLLEAPDDPGALANLAALLAHTGELDQAKARYIQALAASRDPVASADIHVELAIVLHKLGELDASAAELDAGLAVVPEHPRAWLVRANHERAAGELGAAAKAYARALAADPDLVEAHNNLGVTLEQLDRPGEAAAAFASAAALAPADPRYRVNLGRARERSGDFDGAIAAYRAALERDGSSLEAMRGLAWCLATHPDPSRRDPVEAMGVAELGDRLAGGRSPELLEALALALAASGRSDAARQALARALALARTVEREDLIVRYEALEAELGSGRPPGQGG